MDKQMFINILTDIYFERLCYDGNATDWQKGFLTGESKAINRLMKQIFTEDEYAEIRKTARQKARRSFADLEKLTAVIDDQYIMNIYNSGNNADKCLDDIILDKSGWHIHEV